MKQGLFHTQNITSKIQDGKDKNVGLKMLILEMFIKSRGIRAWCWRWKDQSPALGQLTVYWGKHLLEKLHGKFAPYIGEWGAFEKVMWQSRALTGDANEPHLGLKAARGSPGRQEASGSGSSICRGGEVLKSPHPHCAGGQIGPCRGHAGPVARVPARQLFIATLWAMFSLTYLSLLLGIPCGFCLRDEQKWKEV